MQTTQEVKEARHRTQSYSLLLTTGAALVILCCFFFFHFYWNRFAGLRSGNGSFEGGIGFLAGSRPYRDYFTAGPPLNVLISAAVLAAFGKTLAVIRAYGVFERLVLATLLYLWLTRLFRISTAAIATIVAVVISAGDPSDTLSSYNFAAILFGTVAGLTASFFLDRDRSTRALTVLAVLSGISASMSFATKQTIGMGAMVAVPILASLSAVKLSGAKKAIIFVIGYAAGWLITELALILWLVQLGVFHDFVVDVFAKGPSAKGAHASDYVIRTVRATYHLIFPWIAGCLCLLLLLPSFARIIRTRSQSPEGRSAVWILSAMSAISIGLGALLSYGAHTFLNGLPNYPIFFGFYGSGLLGLIIVIAAVRGTFSERQAQLLLLSGVSFSVAFMLSLSWPALDGMLYPALGLVLAATIDGLRNKYWQWAVYGACAVLLVSETCDRLNRPQGFHEWVDPPVREATVASTIPELAGLRLPASVVHFLDATVAIISQHSAPSDTIFCYPEFGIVYALAHRRPPTLTGSHNIDVVNDEFARAEAQRVLDRRPAVLIYYRIPYWSLRADEVLWRRGKPSGQRDLINAMETLISQYRLAGSFHIPPNEVPVLVYVRK